MSKTESHLLPLSMMAAHLGVTAKWLRGEVDAGRIPALRAGDRLLFNAPAVEAVLAKRATKKAVAHAS